MRPGEQGREELNMGRIVDIKFYKPEMSSVYTHVVLYYKNGMAEWLELPKPEFHIKGERELFSGEEPLDAHRWNIIPNSQFFGDNPQDEYHKMINKYEQYQSE